jgi:hypothetical protein
MCTRRLGFPDLLTPLVHQPTRTVANNYETFTKNTQPEPKYRALVAEGAFKLTQV